MGTLYVNTLHKVILKGPKFCRILFAFLNHDFFKIFFYQGMTRRKRMDLVFWCLEMMEEVYLLLGMWKLSISHSNTKFRVLYPSLRTIYSIRFSQPPKYIFYQVVPASEIYILSGSLSLQNIYSIRFSQPPKYIFY